LTPKISSAQLLLRTSLQRSTVPSKLDPVALR
jgi:hypothetical protein